MINQNSILDLLNTQNTAKKAGTVSPKTETSKADTSKQITDLLSNQGIGQETGSKPSQVETDGNKPLEAVKDNLEGIQNILETVQHSKQLSKKQLEVLDKFEEILDESFIKLKQGITPEIEKNLTQFNARSIVQIEGNRIIIDENKLDLFSYFDQELKPWKPKVNLPPYSSLTQLQLDIETTGLDPETCRVVLIGLMNERGVPLIIDCLHNEKTGLLQFLDVLNKKKPELLNTFNGFKFDLPFLIRRMEMYGIKHPFTVNMKREKCFKVAQMFGQPTIYNDIYLKIAGKDVTIIDLYHQVLAWDFVARKLTKYSLRLLS